MSIEPLERPDTDDSDVLDAVFGMLSNRLVRPNGLAVRPHLAYPYIRIPVSHSPNTSYLTMRVSEGTLVFMFDFNSVTIDLSDPGFEPKLLHAIRDAARHHCVEIACE